MPTIYISEKTCDEKHSQNPPKLNITRCYRICSKEEVVTKTEPSFGVALTLKSSTNPNGKSQTAINQLESNLYYPGSTLTITWGLVPCTGCGNWSSNYVKIDLYKGSVLQFTIAPNVPYFATNNFHFDWLVPTLTTSGDDYKIRITSTTNSSHIAESSSFTILRPVPNVGEINSGVTNYVFNGLQCAWQDEYNTPNRFNANIDGMTGATYLWYGGETHLEWTFTTPSSLGYNTHFRTKAGATFPTTITVFVKVSKPGYSDVIKSRSLTLQNCVYVEE